MPLCGCFAGVGVEIIKFSNELQVELAIIDEKEPPSGPGDIRTRLDLQLYVLAGGYTMFLGVVDDLEMTTILRKKIIIFIFIFISILTTIAEIVEEGREG